MEEISEVDASGSSTQISILSQDSNFVTIFRTLYGVTKEEASLATVFHPKAIWDQMS